jgi:hypothetical protein
LAEQLVEEWLNRNGFFTIRGMRLGVNEIDLLAIKPTPTGIEARHVEVQVSFRPISYLGKLNKEEQKELGYKSANSAGKRPARVIKAGIAAWVDKKFFSAKKRKMREMVLSEAKWQYQLVHAEVHHQDELKFIQKHGVKTIRLDSIVAELCASKHPFSMGAGTDISELIRYCPQPNGKGGKKASAPGLKKPKGRRG